MHLFSFTHQFKNLHVATSSKLQPEEEFFQQLNIDPNEVIAGQQRHTANVVVVPNGADVLPQTDGLITQLANTPLMVVTADCAPIVLFDPTQRVLALVHVGWRGAVAGILPNCVRKLEQEFDASARNLWVGIGPMIQRCHYEVKQDLIEEVSSSFPDFTDLFYSEENHFYFDFSNLLTQELKQLGVPDTQIEDVQLCTACDTTTWHSHRAEQGKAGRIRTLAWLSA